MIRIASRYLVSALIVFSLFAIWAAVAGAQEQSVCLLKVYQGGKLVQSGSAAVIGLTSGYADPPEGYYWGIVASADHVISNDDTTLAGDEFLLTFKQGAVIRVKPEGVLARNSQTDLVLMAALVPNEVRPLVLSLVATADERVRAIGYPGHTAETTEGRFLRYCDKQNRYFADLFVRGGYSGGVCVNDKDEIVGMISGGWRWVEDENGHTHSTWPTCGGTSNGLKVLAESLAVK